MADLKSECCIECDPGKIGEGLWLEVMSDGCRRVHPAGQTCDGNCQCWEHFHDVLVYAREAENNPKYVQAAKEQNSVPAEVATVDFFHPPYIYSLDLAEYHGHPGDLIVIGAKDSVSVTRVGVMIVDDDYHLIEMGMAVMTARERWEYTAVKHAGVKHVLVIVDAADLPGHLSERRADKEVG